MAKVFTRIARAPLLIAVMVLGVMGVGGLLGVLLTRDLATSGASSVAVYPEMVSIPAGRFTMGSPDDETDRDPDEGPLREVAISSFEASKTEITFAQWESCVAGGGCRRYRPGDEGWGRGDRPVIKVSWNDAQHYVQWLSQATGRTYRLLTEAEWEYAARAGSTTTFATGTTITPAQARFLSQSTAPVGSYPPNTFGLYDMHGNVWEWVEDCYAESYAGAPTDGGAVEAERCSVGVLRGGAWGTDDASGLRAADRFRVNRRDREFYFGFRVAQSVG